MFDFNEDEIKRMLVSGEMSQAELQSLLSLMMTSPQMKGAFITVADPNSEEGKIAHEYIDYHKFLPKSYPQVAENDISSAKDVLSSTSSSIDDKKKALILLAHIGRPKIVKLLEKYQEQVEKELAFWLKTAIDECKTFLKSEILEEPFMNIEVLNDKQSDDDCSCGCGGKY
jgi:hypothetical protein